MLRLLFLLNMFHQTIKSLFTDSVASIVSDISQYTVNPGKDLSRNKKLPAGKLISFLVSEGSSSTKNELLDFFGMDVLAPTASAFNQPRAKLKPDALEAVFKRFNSSVNSMEKTSGYRFLANEEYDNKPIGIILCTDKDALTTEYALGGLSNNIFASKYTYYIPDKDQLIAEVEKIIKKLED